MMALAGYGQITPTPTGAKITLDSVTTEIIVYAPTAVRVVKYVGERPALKPLKIKGVPQKPTEGPFRSEGGHNKYKLDTGAMWAALNEKDANVSFWNLGDTLVMAEQHKTGILAPSTKGKGYKVSQDFQMGRANVNEIYCPLLKDNSRVNLKGTVTAVGDRKAGLPKARIATDKGFQIVWLCNGDGSLDALPREGKKNGDVTFTTFSAPMIDYLFIKD